MRVRSYSHGIDVISLEFNATALAVRNNITYRSVERQREDNPEGKSARRPEIKKKMKKNKRRAASERAAAKCSKCMAWPRTGNPSFLLAETARQQILSYERDRIAQLRAHRSATPMLNVVIKLLSDKYLDCTGTVTVAIARHKPRRRSPMAYQQTSGATGSIRRL